MALLIQLDIAGSFVTEEGFSVVHGMSSPVKMVTKNAWILPSGQGAILKPINFEATWPAAAGKTKLTDFTLDNTAWEQIKRGDNNALFMSSKGNASGTLVSPQFDPNQALFLETFVYGVSGQPLDDYLVCQFGQWFNLHIHADGTADVEDLRPGALQQFLAEDVPLASGGQDLIGKLLQIAIIPWRRGRILFVTNQGSYFEVSSGTRPDTSDALKGARTPGEDVYYVTTESAQVTLTPNPAVRALLTINTLRNIANSGTVGIVPTATPYAPVAGPIEARVQAEMQDGCAAVLSLKDGAGNAYAPTPMNRPEQIAWTVTMTAPKSTVTPQLFGVDIRFDRGLGNRVYTTNNIGSPQSANLTLSRDRGQKSFSFTLDNPNDRWTSVKDLWNRKVRVYLQQDGVDAAMAEIFSGYSDPVEFIDGRDSKITVPCSGRRKMLRYSLLSDSQRFDAMTHASAVYRILYDAGVDPADIIVEEDGVTLDEADFGEEPLWRPANGQSRDEFIQHICDTFSGYVFDDIGGRFYYCSRDYFTRAALAGTISIPTIYQQTPIDTLTQMPIAAARGPNPAIMVALANSVKQSDATEPLANDFWVLGRDGKTGEIVAAHYVDTDSISNRTAFNYVGERRVFIYATAAIASVDSAQRTLGVLAARLSQPIRPVSFDLPDYQMSIPIDGPVNIEGFGLALITEIGGAEWTNDRWRRTSYSAELL
ncbi:hypothetical protein CCAX7_54490 [Capsulimonas corticalis]|uniref:Uncharacterized protein n=1 Tax=Capsulimonas corticalis TaxID=2219043 RepID=A0A402D5T6_9BACT|nr:hypothetical protein [Capsulimonas corticalis]BDI33398.1 hypothetical protein CCAX7_54490 [Capsulimonas corticalis]